MVVFETLEEAKDYIFYKYDWLNTTELDRYYDEYIFEYKGKFMVPSIKD